jgi:hypothetical protein
MSVTKPMRHRTSSIIIFDEPVPLWPPPQPPLEQQLSFMDLATPVMESHGVSGM